MGGIYYNARCKLENTGDAAHFAIIHNAATIDNKSTGSRNLMVFKISYSSKILVGDWCAYL